MPLIIPTLDDRRYQDLLDEALARIPIHNPEWTNFNESDPGVTLIQVFAFLTENLLYRSNQIPERNRRKFLSLLGVPLQAASAARGIVTFSNERGALRTLTLNDGLEVRAGQTPFRTETGLDVLPIEAQVFYKRGLDAPPDQLSQLRQYYAELYRSFRGQPPDDPANLRLYETVALPPRSTTGVDLSLQTIDSSLWVALLARATDKPYALSVPEAREAIAGKTISLGLVPYFDAPARELVAVPISPQGTHLLEFQIPKMPATGGLPKEVEKRVPDYQSLATRDVPLEPCLVQITLPAAPRELALWNNLDPLESGTGDFPPNLEDTTLNERVITWLRITAPASAQFKVLWAGINAVFANQRAHVANELLSLGTGEPDQVVVLAKAPVIPQSVQLSVAVNDREEVWTEIDDLLSAGPEVPTPDLRQPPGAPAVQNNRINVFTVNAESGEIRFGDGVRGRRPPRDAILRASYDYGVGRDGNVGPNSIDTGPALPAGVKVTNPVRTWGGAEAETVSDGEKQIARYLQHRDRLVSAADFETIARRTPGVDLGRVDVLPLFNPNLGQAEPGDAAGAVTLMLVPTYDAAHPDTPEPDQNFLNAVCTYLEPRRLITTELFLRKPNYRSIWISLGFRPIAGASVAQVRETIKQTLYNFLSPLPNAQNADPQHGWPLSKPVVDRELMAVASRVPGVQLVKDVLLAEGTNDPADEIDLSGLDLPRIAGISISVGDPIPIDQLRGQPSSTPPGSGEGVPPSSFVPVPVIAEECACLTIPTSA